MGGGGLACSTRPLQAQCQCCLWRRGGFAECVLWLISLSTQPGVWGSSRISPGVFCGLAQHDALLINLAVVFFLLTLNGAVRLSTSYCWPVEQLKGSTAQIFVGKTRIMFTLACRIKLSISRSNTACIEWHQSIGTGHSYNQFHVQHKGRLLLEHSSPALVYQCTKIPAQRKLTGCVMLTERVLVYSPSQWPVSIFMV